MKSTSPKDRTKLLEQHRQWQRRYRAKEKASKESKKEAKKPFSDSLPVKFASPKMDSKSQARPGKVCAISLPEKSTLIEEPLFLSNGKINEKLIRTRWIVVRAAPYSLYGNQQPDFKLGDPIPTTWSSSQYIWRETEQWSREPINYGMSFEEAARTGKPKSFRTCSKCGYEVSTNEEDHKEECARVIKRRIKKETN